MHVLWQYGVFCGRATLDAHTPGFSLVEFSFYSLLSCSQLFTATSCTLPLVFLAAVTDIATSAPVDDTTTIAGQHNQSTNHFHHGPHHDHRCGASKSVPESPETDWRFEGGVRQGNRKRGCCSWPQVLRMKHIPPVRHRLTSWASILTVICDNGKSPVLEHASNGLRLRAAFEICENANIPGLYIIGSGHALS